MISVLADTIWPYCHLLNLFCLCFGFKDGRGQGHSVFCLSFHLSAAPSTPICWIQNTRNSLTRCIIISWIHLDRYWSDAQWQCFLLLLFYFGLTRFNLLHFFFAMTKLLGRVLCGNTYLPILGMHISLSEEPFCSWFWMETIQYHLLQVVKHCWFPKLTLHLQNNHLKSLSL